MPIVLPDPVQMNLAAKVVFLSLTTGAGGDLLLAKLDLFVNNVTPTPLMGPTDLGLPTFTGYTQKAVTGWGTIEHTAQGAAIQNALNVVEWQGPGDDTGQTIYGYMIRSTAAGNPLFFAARFPVPVGLAHPGDILDLVAAIIIP